MSYPLISFKENKATEVNDEFEVFTGYIRGDIIGKTKDEFRRIFKIPEIENISNGESFYLFIKNYEPREVIILLNKKSENEETLYIYEKWNSRLEDNFPYLESFVQQNVGLAIYNATDGKALKVNQTFLNFVNVPNISLDDIIGEKMHSHPDYNFEDIYEKIINDGQPYLLIEVCSNFSGDKYYNINFIPIYVKGKMKFLLQTVTDVTEIVLSKEVIEKQKQELEAIIDNISEEIIIFNKNCEILKMNKLAKKNAIFDYNITSTLYDACNHYSVSYIDGIPLLEEEKPFNKILKGESITDLRIVRKNKNLTQYREISGRPLYDNEGNFIAGIVVSRDISEQLKYEENLYAKAQYGLIAKIIENFDFGFARLSYPDFKYIDINNKAYELYKKINPNIGSQASIIGQCISKYDKINVDKLNEKLLKCFYSNKSYIHVNKYIINNEEIFQKFIVQPLYGINNEIIEIIIIGIDVTKDEKAINILQKTISIQDEIYSNVSHELKTPLNVIFSANQIMNMYLTNDELFDKTKFIVYNNNIKQNCYRLIKLINNIVDLTKKNSGNFNINIINGNIVETINNIVQSVSEYTKDKGLQISYTANVEEKIMAYDPNLIERIMLNLISNAIKFSNDGKQIYVKVVDNNRNVEISVKDEGIGIDKKHLDSLFIRFYRANKSLSRNTEGSGIGLSLVKSLVELHDGTIQVESELGKGSTFKIILPARITENQEQNAKTINNESKIEMINIEFSDIYNN